MVKAQSISDTKPQAPLVSWVPVTDTDGHTHMEMRWHVGESKHARHTPRSAA